MNTLSNRWKILEAKAQIDPTDKSRVKFIFVMQRISLLIHSHVIVPGYILITLTLSILWMPHDHFMRPTLSGANIYLHFNLMDRVWWQ